MKYIPILVLCVFIPILAFSDDTTITSNTTWPAGTYTFGNVTITNNSTLSCTGISSTGAGVIINCDNLTVDAGSKISADSFGHSASVGLGAPGSSNGAGYGGKGGLFYLVGKSYGSASQPVNLGSGGGVAAGGGCIIINPNNAGKCNIWVYKNNLLALTVQLSIHLGDIPAKLVHPQNIQNSYFQSGNRDGEER